MADPSVVVDRALSVHQEYPNKRLVVHFLPPHTPFLVRGGEPIPEDSEYRTFHGVRNGTVTESEMREVYRENVEYVLDFVEELVDGLDGKTVVSADHGELLGEGVSAACRLLHPRWSFRDRANFDYGHYSKIRVPELVEVPWLELPHNGRRRIVAADEPAGVEMDEEAIDEQLEALGYK
jgi:hypothetical protein